WCLTGRDSAGEDFGVAAATDPDEAAVRLRDWVLDSLLAAAGDGEDRLGDLLAECPTDRDCLAFGPSDLLPVRIRLLRAKHGWGRAACCSPTCPRRGPRGRSLEGGARSVDSLDRNRR